MNKELEKNLNTDTVVSFFSFALIKTFCQGQLKGDGVYLARSQVPSRQNQGVRSSMQQSILHLKSEADNECMHTTARVHLLYVFFFFNPGSPAYGMVPSIVGETSYLK